MGLRWRESVTPDLRPWSTGEEWNAPLQVLRWRSFSSRRLTGRSAHHTSRLWIQAGEMGFFQRFSRLSFREKLRGLVISRDSEYTTQLFHIKKNQLSWFGHPQRYEMSSQQKVWTYWEITFLGWVGNALVSSQRNWKRWLWRRRPRALCSHCCPCNLSLDKQRVMDEWLLKILESKRWSDFEKVWNDKAIRRN